MRAKFWRLTMSRGSRGRGRRTAALIAISLLPVAGGTSAALASGAGRASASRTLTHTVPRLIHGARDVGAISPAQRISFALALELPQRAALDRYVAGEYMPGSGNFHAFLTPVQFGRRFGAPEAEVQHALAAVRALGLTPAAPSINHLYLQASGTVASVQRAFGVRIDRFRRAGGRTFYANTSDIRLPSSLNGLVTGVVGLDSSSLPHSHLMAAPRIVRAPRAARQQGIDGGATPCPQASAGGGYTAPQLATGYDFNGQYAKGFHGEGMSAALLEFDDFHNSNVATVESCYGLHIPVTRRLVNGGLGGPPASGEAEDMADITTILEMDPKLAHLIVYEAPIIGGAALLDQGPAEIDLYNAYVTDDRAPVISSSWGMCEETQSQAYDQLFAAVAEEAAAQGQQIFDASGDSGAVDCRGAATPTTGSISVEQESAVPWITGVGGTDLGVLTTASASAPHDEDTWNDGGAGGGGQSVAWTMPAWQASYLAARHDHPQGAANSCGAPRGQLCRMVPDIAMNADPEAGGAANPSGPTPPQFFPSDVGSPGYSIYCGTANCSLVSAVGGPPPPGSPPGGAGGWYPIGGTSLATPLAASAAVLWDQQARKAGLGSYGFLNPSLYRIASDPKRYAADFHDITTDTNDAQYDPADCPPGCNPHHLYAAGPGYDMASGLGSVDVANLAGDLIADSGHVDASPSRETMYGYLRGPRTTQPVAITSGYRHSSYTARSNARWLHVVRSGRVPGTLKWYVDPKGLRSGSYAGQIRIQAANGAVATVAVSYLVTPRATISLSPRSLHFHERAIDSNGSRTSPSCGSTIWNDELKNQLTSSSDNTPVDRSTKQTLFVANSGPRASRLHYAVFFYSYTSSWLTQDLNPANNPNGYKTRPVQPLVPSVGVLAGRGRAARIKLASIANANQIGGYPAMNQGTYRGIVEVRDLADPSVLKRMPVTLVLGSGKHTPTIAVNHRSIAVKLRQGAHKTVSLVLRDASASCGYAYSLQFTGRWASTRSDLYSGSVGAHPARSAPSASDTGEGNGFTPVTFTARGLAPGVYRAQVIIESQTAVANPTRVSLTLTVTRR